ncbi:MAG: LacI family DNA-binding transcriptional regulator [Lachnospiraceae bacterium]|nr:LacI family DNA-binding transcriptional regulator [Lachnospiraceae bacterium]
MKKKVVMKDIAEAMGVSIVTVSKALAGKEGVSERVRGEIIRKAEELGYVIGEKKKGEQNNKIAILIPERYVSEKSFYVQIYQRMIMAFSEKGLIGLLEIVRRENEEEGILPNSITSGAVDQAVLVGELHAQMIESLISSEVRLIFFDFQNEEYDVDAIVGDNINGGYLLTRYLVKKGYEKIGFVGEYRATRSILDRFTGYMKYLLAKGREMNPEWVIPDRDADGENIDLKLPLANMPQAFVCNNDDVAYRLIRNLQEAGYRVPEQIAIVGYDDYAAQESAGLALTTYHVNVEEMIRICIQIVEARITDPGYRSGTITVNGCLVEGDSV